jgi:hypothetical protein
MLTLEWFRRMFPDQRFTREQLAYCRYLEQQGLKFCVDFGYENAEAIAWQKLEEEEFILGHA